MRQRRPQLRSRPREDLGVAGNDGGGRQRKQYNGDGDDDDVNFLVGVRRIIVVGGMGMTGRRASTTRRRYLELADVERRVRR